MRVVQMNDNGQWGRGLAELNQHVQHERKGVRGGVTGDGQGLSEEDESRIIEGTGTVNGRKIKPVQQAQVDVQNLPQHTQEHKVHWERFLPVRSLKVLLVENDDSTRQVVTALLRNCSYKVTPVSDALEAWKILEDSVKHIDLVLTELVMPGLSGIGLLAKIMTHKTCQNIPVIIMSSHDSMGVVFKCLSKGAVDFLVKPIRKNELKNLWQHIWRKCHSSCGSRSGSGSGSGVQTGKSTKSRSVEEPENVSDSSAEDDNRSIGLGLRDGSDNGSGTQSSWTKRAVEIESPPPMSTWEEHADPPDITCAQVIHSRPEAYASSWVPIPAEDHGKRDDQLGNIAMGKDLDSGGPRTVDLQPEEAGKRTLSGTIATDMNQFPQLDSEKNIKKVDKENVHLGNGSSTCECTKQANDLTAPKKLRTGSEMDGCLSGISEVKVKGPGNEKDIPSLELSLKRLDDVVDTKTGPHDQIILRHSLLSAFTRYNNGSVPNQTQTRNGGSCSPMDSSSEAAKSDSIFNLRFMSNGTPPNQVSNSSSNNNDTGSTTNKSITKPSPAINKQTAKSGAPDASHPSAFKSVKHGVLTTPQVIISSEASEAPGNTLSVEDGNGGQQVWIQYHHHHHHYHHRHVYGLKHERKMPEHGDLSAKDMASGTPQCGSSNMTRTPAEVNTAICSVNGSGSGSNHGSNMHNGSSTSANPEGTNLGSDCTMVEKGGAGDGNGGHSIPLYENRSAQRLAALNKFRLKRKERCFEKKVRYQSRKKLAEQRPRIRGQFVRQVPEDNSTGGDG